MTATPPARIDHLRIERGRDDAFSGLTHEQRVRLIVQVLCGLVAYDGQPSAADTPDRATESRVAADLTDRLAS